MTMTTEEALERYAVGVRAVSHVRVNFVASLDGAATLGGRSGALGDEEDQRVLRALRALADVLLVGAGTLRSEGYGPLRLDGKAVGWRREQGLPDHPVLAVVSGSLALDPRSAALAEAPVRPLVLTHAAAPADRRAALAEVADVVDCGDTDVDPVAVRVALADRGLPQILCEGGPSLFGSLLAADVVDELCLTLAPVLTGGDASRIAVAEQEVARGMVLEHAVHGESMLFLRYRRAADTR